MNNFLPNILSTRYLCLAPCTPESAVLQPPPPPPLLAEGMSNRRKIIPILNSIDRWIDSSIYIEIKIERDR